MMVLGDGSRMLVFWLCDFDIKCLCCLGDLAGESLGNSSGKLRSKGFGKWTKDVFVMISCSVDTW